MKRTLEALVVFSWMLTFCCGQNTNIFCGSGQCNTDESQNIQIGALVTEIRIMKDALESERRERQEEVTSLREEIRSTYVRWGRTSCPDTATLVYEGKYDPSFNNHLFS